MLATPSRPGILSRKQVLPVYWQPDDLWDEREPLTFVAVMYHPRRTARSIEQRRQQVYTLAVKSTGNPDEYTRVGLAMWADCGWFGYQCAEDYGAQAEAWGKLGKSHHGLREPELCRDGKHVHPTLPDPLMKEDFYHESARMVRKTVHIV